MTLAIFKLSIAQKNASLDKRCQISYYLSGKVIMNEQKQEPKKEANKQQVVGLLMAEAGFEFAGLIAIPLVAGLLIGKWLDRKYNHHFFVIIGILLGITITCFAIYSRIKDYKKMLK
jgi:hypothetical protein